MVLLCPKVVHKAENKYKIFQAFQDNFLNMVFANRASWGGVGGRSLVNSPFPVVALCQT